MQQLRLSVEKGTDQNRITLFRITVLESTWLYKQQIEICSCTYSPKTN